MRDLDVRNVGALKYAVRTTARPCRSPNNQTDPRATPKNKKTAKQYYVNLDGMGACLIDADAVSRSRVHSSCNL